MLKHIGIIMDGNRRWAKAHAMELYKGHDSGAKIFGHVCDWCLQEGVSYLTVYAFSTENWQRTDKEINHLFSLMERYFVEEKARCIEKGIRIKVIGERDRFSARVMAIIDEIERATENCTELYVQIALSYGGRDEIVRAARGLLTKALAAEDVTEDVFAGFLDTAGVPDVDLVIRTGGAENRRLSNFLPWQTVYAELFFSDLLWPDFSQEEFKRALEYYATVKKKLGK